MTSPWFTRPCTTCPVLSRPSPSSGHDSQALSMALSKRSCPANTGQSHPLHFAPGVPSLCEWEPEGVHLLPLPYRLNQVTKEGRLQTMASRWQGKCLLETENLL